MSLSARPPPITTYDKTTNIYVLVTFCTDKGDPTLFEEAIRSVYSFEWQEAMEVEMNSMNTNDIWDLKVIPNGAKTVGC